MDWRRLVSLSAVSLLFLACGDEALDSALGDLTISPGTVDFGQVWIGERAEQTLAFENDGRVAAHVDASGLDAPFDGTAKVVVPAAGQVVEVQVGFRPLEPGVVEREIAFTSTDGQSVVVPFRGEGIPVLLDVAEELNFGAVRVGERLELPLLVSNDAPLAITAFRSEISGEDARAFSVAREIRQVPAHSSAELLLAFAPAVPEPQVATLEVWPCAACDVRRVLLRGRGVDVDLTATPPLVDFGPVPPEKSRTMAVQLRNRGEAVASLPEAYVEGEWFSLGAPDLPADLGEGDTLDLEVTFTPEGLGEQQGRLVVLGEGRKVAIEVPLRGYGGGPELVATPPALDLDDRPLGWRGSTDIAVANVGEDVPVQILGAAIEGDGAWAASAPDLPAEVGEGLAFRVDFAAAALGDAPATLVLATSSPGQPELRVPLAARVVENPGCAIAAVPAEVRFGLVLPDLAHQQTVTLRNVGDESCILWDLRLDPEGSMSFFLPSPPQDRELLPTEEMEVAVVFSPLGPSPDVQTTRLLYRTTNPLAPEGEVPVRGYAPGIRVVAIPSLLDFGVVPVNRAPRLPLQIRGQGYPMVRVVGVGFAPESDLAFSLVSWPPFPAPTDIGVDLVLDFRPEEGRGYQGLLEVRLEGALEPLLVRLLGEGDDGPCGEACEPPVPTCPAPQEGLVNQQVTLVGSGVDPNGDPITCEWAVLRAPPGSSAQPDPVEGCTTGFTPDLVGDYIIRLRVMDPLGNIGECTTLFTSRAPTNGLWVEMFWDVPNDVDLHLLHEDGGDPLVGTSWYGHPLVCFYGNCKQDRQTGLPVLPWDLPGTADDPSLDRDDVQTVGPENIRIDAPTPNQDYHVGVNFFTMRNGPTYVTTNIYCGGVLSGTDITHLTFDDERIFIGTVRFDDQDFCTWTPVNLPVMPNATGP